MAELTPVTLTPQEQAEFEQQQQPSGPAPLNPIRDLTTEELFDLASKDSEFDIASEFGRNKDLHADPAIVQKAADALHMVRERGFQLSDLPGPAKVATAVGGIVKGFGKQAWNYLTAGVNTAMSLVTEPGTSDALTSEAQRRVAENIAGSESAVTGLAEMGARGVQKVGRGLGLAKPLTAFTPEEKVKELFDAAGKVEVQEDIAQGKGAFMTAAGGEVIKELEAEGKPVRPEEVTQLAAGDPFSWWTFGKVLGGTGKLAGAAVPQAARTAAARVGEALPSAEAVAGRTIQAAGETARIGAAAASRIAPAVGFLKGMAEAGPIGALAGLKGGELARTITRRIGSAGERVAQFGREVAAPGAATGAGVQLARDVAASAPGVAGATAHGLAMDIGLAAVTSESPMETESSVGIGAALGAAGGARQAGRRILSGQLIAPRTWGTNRPVPSSGQFPSLDAFHTVAYQTAAPAVRTRVNAIREFAQGAAPGTDVFLFRDAPSVERALTEAGVSPEQAQQFSQQSGFFTVDLPTRDGSQRRAIIVRDIEAAPHESFHAIQDVLGEAANREIDALIQRQYADQWENEGNKYAARLNDNQPVQNWRDTVNDASGWGHAEAMEKLSREAGNRIRNETGAEPDPTAVRDMVQAAWNAASRDSAGNPREAWREILTPEEQAAVADRYIAREIAAENFDAIFKHTGSSLNDQPGILGSLSRIAGNLVSAMGGEPLAGRTSEFGQVPLSTPVVEAVRGAARERLPVVEPPSSAPAATPSPRSPVIPGDPAQEAQEIASALPDAVPVGGTRSPRELLTDIANAIGQRAGVRINYLSAPGEPAAATTSNRTARRAIIEAFRSMPAAARSLWEKTFFPERVFRRSGDRVQIFGWAPEVFASNAHKLAQVLAADPNLQRFSPYALDPATRTFTEAGWRELFADTQKFVQNQMAGQTGAGEQLVVPRETAARGVFAPESRPAEATPLAQDRADFISMLFNSRLPDTPRLSVGRPSLNIVGQEISAATAPGRVERPVVARQPFAGEEAQRQGVEGREIMEVNPLRNALTRELGDRMPSFIEANQRLNLENIREVQVTPEVPQFRGNTLTLAAGFQPRTAAGKKIVEEKGFEYRHTPPDRFGVQKISLHDLTKAEEGFVRKEDEPDPTEIAYVEIGEENPTTAHLEFIWVSPDYRKQGIGEALQREAGAFVRDEGYAKLTGTIVSPEAVKLAEKVYPGTKFETQRDRKGNAIPIVLRESPISPESQFQPKAADRARELLTMDDATWEAATKYQGKMGGGFTGWAYEIGAAVKDVADLQALRETYNTLSESARAAMAAKDMTAAMTLVAKAQAAREAYEAATGETLDGRSEATVPFMRRHLDPNYNPPLPGEAFKRWEAEQGETIEAQAQPKDFKFKKLGSGGFKKAWILPDGKPIQLGGTWHHDWLSQNPDVAKRYGLTVPKFTGTDSEGVREDALKKGFVRVNFGVNNGTLTIEGRARDWRKIKPAMEQLVEANMDDVYNVTVHLFDDKISKTVDSETQRIFNFDDAEKMDHLPFTDRDPRGVQMQPAKFDAETFESSLEEIRSGRASGQTFNPDGSVWSADAPSDIVSLASVNVPRDNLTREQFEKAVSPYKKLLERPGIVAGVFSFIGEDGKPVSSIDINAVVPKEFRDNTTKFAKANDQISIWDAENSEEVKTGGKGDTKLRYVNEMIDAADALQAGQEFEIPERPKMQVKMMSVKDEMIDDVKNVAKGVKDFFTGQSQPERRIRGAGFFRNLMAKENQAEQERLGVKIPTDEQVTEALSSDKKEFVGAHRELERGTPVGVRIDIPAYLRSGDFVQTVHEKAKGGQVGKRIGYDAIVTLDNPTFFSNESGAVKIREGAAKFPVATVEGEYNPMRTLPKDMDEWTEVGYNPKKHSYFYEKGSEEPVISGSKAVSVGNSVFVKDAVFGDRKKFQFSAGEMGTDLLGEPEKRSSLTGAQINAMSRAKLREHFPEAVIPQDREELMSSDIVGSPLFKKSKTEEKAVEAFARRLVEFANQWKDHPSYKDGLAWYSEFVPMLAEQFGKDAPIVAELLAATSPQTSVNTNYRYALEAIDLMNSGKLEGITQKFEQGLEKMADGSWKEWIDKEIAAGKVPKVPKKISEATFLAHWIETHNLKPVRNNGRLFGQHSVPVLQVLARKWLSEERGLKTQNFVKNLLGTGHEATIDLWADRTMRRMGYEGFKDRWRILAGNQGGVSDADFLFSQKAYRRAAEQLGVEPDSLQAALWFAEKQLWADNGWGRLDLGDFRQEIKKTPQLRAEAASHLTKDEESATVKGEEQPELITPRYER